MNRAGYSQQVGRAAGRRDLITKPGIDAEREVGGTLLTFRPDGSCRF
jgi:hypothetical protein